MFEDTTFESGSFVVPPDAEMLIYSDGAFELTLPDGTLWALTEFVGLCAAWPAPRSGHWIR